MVVSYVPGGSLPPVTLAGSYSDNGYDNTGGPWQGTLGRPYLTTHFRWLRLEGRRCPRPCPPLFRKSSCLAIADAKLAWCGGGENRQCRSTQRTGGPRGA
jgi:hypothetical protein